MTTRSAHRAEALRIRDGCGSGYPRVRIADGDAEGEDGDWNGPEYLKGLIDRATRITLEDRRTMQVDLTLRK